jgi:hypothetical protein
MIELGRVDLAQVSTRLAALDTLPNVETPSLGRLTQHLANML